MKLLEQSKTDNDIIDNRILYLNEIIKIIDLVIINDIIYFSDFIISSDYISDNIIKRILSVLNTKFNYKINFNDIVINNNNNF